MKKINSISQRKSALIAGISLLVMAVVAGLSYGYLHGNLVVADDAQATLDNLKTSTDLFYAEIFGWKVIFILDGLVAWSLYHFFKKSNKGLAFLSSFLRVIYTAFLGIAIYNLPQVMTVINDQLGQFGMNNGMDQVMHYLNSFEDIWSKSLIIFGFHLTLLGFLAFKADYVPKIWGVLLVIAGFSYSYLHGMYAFFPQIKEHLIVIESILSVPMIVGEVGFAVWLVARGGKLKSQNSEIQQNKELQASI